MTHKDVVRRSFEEAVTLEMAEVFRGDKHHPVKPTFAQSLKTDLAKCLFAFCRVVCLQADQKQQDYGSENLTQFGAQGVLVRWADKLSRLRNLYDNKRGPVVVSESVADTWRDGIVYDMIGYLMEAKLWPLQVTEQLRDSEGHVVATATDDRRKVFLGQVGPVESRRHVPVASPGSDTGEAEGSVSLQGTSSAPTHEYEELHGEIVDNVARAHGVEVAGIGIHVAQGGSGDAQDLIEDTLKVCVTISRQLMPPIGAMYKLRSRAPGRVIVDIVLPNYGDPGTAPTICIVFHEVNPQASQTVPVEQPNHLRVEPLCWFDEHYQPE